MSWDSCSKGKNRIRSPEVEEILPCDNGQALPRADTSRLFYTSPQVSLAMAQRSPYKSSPPSS